MRLFYKIGAARRSRKYSQKGDRKRKMYLFIFLVSTKDVYEESIKISLCYFKLHNFMLNLKTYCRFLENN